MNLEDFFEVESKPKKKVLMYDFHNFMYRTIFAAQREYSNSIVSLEHVSDKNDIYVFWKNYMIANLFGYVKQFTPDVLIVSVDSKKTWRKDLYPDYKGGRKEKLKESAVDFDAFYPIATEFIANLKEIIPNAYVLEVESCEADDVIAVLSKKVFKDDNVIILSTDGDFKQLLQNPNVRIFNPDSKVKSFVNCLNPKEELDLKIVIGDGGNGTGDNIPNILVMEGFEQTGKKTIGVGPSTAQEILENGLESQFVIDKVSKKYPKITEDEIKRKVKENYARNLQLISFDTIPMEIENKILDAYKSYPLAPFNGRKVFDYLLMNRIKKIAEDFQIYSPHLRKLE